jgi:hypothetical protein
MKVLPYAKDSELVEIVTSMMGTPATIRTSKRSIPTDDKIEIAIAEEAQMEMMRLQSHREQDQMPSRLMAVPTMQEALLQAHPRPKSREIQVTWEIHEPAKADFPTQGDRLPVALEDISGIQDPARHRVFLRPRRDETWDHWRVKDMEFRCKSIQQ